MKLIVATALAVVLGAFADPAAAQRTPAAAPVALVGATIVDGSGGEAIVDGVVVLRGDRIEAVGPRDKVTIPAGARRVELGGKWITPGLIDAHVHFFQSGGLYTRPDSLDLRTHVPYAEDLERSKAQLQTTFARYLASGVTTVVDAGGPMWNFEVRRQAAASRAAPRVAVAGPLIATEPTPNQQRLNLGDAPIISAANVAEAQALARAQLPHKPEMIKIWGIGTNGAGYERIREITAAVVAVARPAGVRVAVHTEALAGAHAALDGGADILVHSVSDAPVDTAFAEKLKARNVVYVTTAMVHEGYRDAALGRPDLSVEERRLGDPAVIASLSETPPRWIQRIPERWPTPITQVLANARQLVAVGARVAAGTDAGNIGTVHGPAIHRELVLLTAAGLTPSQALTAATRDAAFAYAAKPDIGLVAPGYRADLLVLDADPLKSVSALSQISRVWSRGTEHDPQTLLPPSPEAVVQRQLERYNAQDIEGFLATYADDAEIFDLIGDARPSQSGKAAIRTTYSRLFANMPELNCRAASRIVEGSYVVDQEVCRAKADARPVRATAVYQVENGLIRRVWFARPATPPGN